MLKGVSHLHLALLLALCSHLSYAGNFYIDINAPAGGTGTAASPLNYLPTYLNASIMPEVGPGDTIFVMPGVYGPTNDFWNHCRVDISGTADKHVVLKGVKDTSGNRPRIVSASVSGLVVGDDSYITIEGFEVVPHDVDINNLGDSGWWLARSGVNISGTFTNVTVRDCYVRDMPGTGIGSGNADYIRIENNIIEHCGFGSNSGNSGISFYRPVDRNGTSFSDHPDYKIIIQGNISRYNVNLRGCTCFNNHLTDGNGIILDSFDDSSYSGSTLIANNVCYGNGGKGISVFKTSNTDIVFNTCYDNANTPDVAQEYPLAIGDHEIRCFNTDNVRVINNIAYNSGNDPGIDGGSNTNYVQSNNLQYNAAGTLTSGEGPVPETDVVGDPDFLGATPLSNPQQITFASSTNPYDPNSASAAFRHPTANGFPVQNLEMGQGSAAVGVADINLFQLDYDINGNPRAGRSDVGAFTQAQVLSLFSDQDSFQAAELKIFPNPLSSSRSNTLYLQGELVKDALEITLVDVAGRSVKSLKLPEADRKECQVALNGLPAGLYKLKINNANKSVVRSVLVQ